MGCWRLPPCQRRRAEAEATFGRAFCFSPCNTTRLAPPPACAALFSESTALALSKTGDRTKERICPIEWGERQREMEREREGGRGGDGVTLRQNDAALLARDSYGEQSGGRKPGAARGHPSRAVSQSLFKVPHIHCPSWMELGAPMEEGRGWGYRQAGVTSFRYHPKRHYSLRTR